MARFFFPLLVLAITAFFGAGHTAAAPRTCSLLPVPGTTVSYRAEVVPWLWFASWQATVDCPGTAMHGKTAQIEQHLGRPIRNNAVIRASTQITIVIDVDFGPNRFDGHVQGRIQQVAGTLSSELQVQAQSSRGLLLQGGERITLQTDTGEILLMPRRLEVHRPR